MPDSEELFDDREIKIIRMFEDGGTFRSVARELHIGTETIRAMLKDPNRKAFQAHYARARLEQGHTYADDVQDVANDPTLTPDEKRIRIDALKWSAARRNRLYTDKASVEMTGKDGKDLIPEAASPRDLAKAVLTLMSKAEKDSS